ncbi:MAG: ATP-grasp domain-containing protein [Candidatus Methanomethylicaceae archaeon]
MVKKLSEREREELLKNIEGFRKEFEGRLAPLGGLRRERPITFISVGGGELGDLAVTAARRVYGGLPGGIRTVAFDRYNGFPAQDASDYYEVFDMKDGDMLEKYIRKYLPDPEEPHAIYLEVEMIDTERTFRLGMEDGYRVMSTPYGPLVCMDRHATKMMFDMLRLERLDWAYAKSDEEIHRIAAEFGLPVIVKPVMTSSGHGTSIVRDPEGLRRAYAHARRHARGIGEEVIVERFLPELKEEGTEITQIVVRHFNEKGKIVNSFLPPIEHRRPGATYHESWLPATISPLATEKCRECATRIADFLGGIGIYAVEQFVIGDKVYNNEVANRPHDTGLITRWMLNMDEGGLQLTSTLGLQVSQASMEISRRGVYGVAHVVLAPDFIEGERKVVGIDLSRINNFMKTGSDFWYFGKPSAYAGRRMGLAVAFSEDLKTARREAERLAHFAEGCIEYGEG